VGAALRTRKGSNPAFVSPGNRIDLPGALDLLLRCDDGLKIPEPTRRAFVRQSAEIKRSLILRFGDFDLG